MGKYAGGRNPKCDLFEMTWSESQSIKIVALLSRSGHRIKGHRIVCETKNVSFNGQAPDLKVGQVRVAGKLT